MVCWHGQNTVSLRTCRFDWPGTFTLSTASRALMRPPFLCFVNSPLTDVVGMSVGADDWHFNLLVYVEKNEKRELRVFEPHRSETGRQPITRLRKLRPVLLRKVIRLLKAQRRVTVDSAV